MTPNARIVSDGTPMGTRLEVNGEPVRCELIDWSINARNVARATVSVPVVAADLTLPLGDLTVIETVASSGTTPIYDGLVAEQEDTRLRRLIAQRWA